MKHEDYVKRAIEEAYKGMRNNHGGPFGAVVVLKDQIIGTGYNSVTSTCDPTAHAEIVAIRNACREISHFHLTDAVMYASCEPCPMCLSAIYWANIRVVYYALDRTDAEKIGFSDKFIYDELTLPLVDRSIAMKQLDLPRAQDLFNEWFAKADRTSY